MDVILNVLDAMQTAVENVAMDVIHVWVNALLHAMRNVLFCVRDHARVVKHHVNMHAEQHA